MSVLHPPVLARPDAPLARANPVAKLGVAVIITIALLPTVDALTPALVLAVELACLPLTGMRLGQIAARTWPLLLAALGVAWSNALFSADQSGPGSGTVVVDWWFVTITTTNLLTGLSLGLRVIAIALPGILALVTTDPTDLTDALVQQLHVPWRFAVGGLAALRLLPLLGSEWRTLGQARRARGIDGGRSPIGRTRVFAGQAFALLVGAVRRGVRLALAMEARGFGSRPDRTYARQQSMASSDWWLLAATGLVVAAATAISVAAGSWELVSLW